LLRAGSKALVNFFIRGFYFSLALPDKATKEAGMKSKGKAVVLRLGAELSLQPPSGRSHSSCIDRCDNNKEVEEEGGVRGLRDNRRTRTPAHLALGI
jgi:hypothetical protein